MCSSDQLAERNKDVLDSIKYAQRIQSSILPPLDKLKHEFPESFVLYQPRDIVSGDFYWFEKVGDFFITACADCTGHGVPGAFMSMIGTTLLSKAVEQKHVVRCEHALTELDKELQKTLQQTRQEDRVVVMDGMDIALIAIDVEALSDADDLGQRVSRMSRKTGSRARTAASRAWKSMREAVKRKPRE